MQSKESKMENDNYDLVCKKLGFLGRGHTSHGLALIEDILESIDIKAPEKWKEPWDEDFNNQVNDLCLHDIGIKAVILFLLTDRNFIQYIDNAYSLTSAGKELLSELREMGLKYIISCW